MEEFRAQILMLTSGIGAKLIVLPYNDITASMLQELKDNGFVSKDTKLAHFRVLFGIPIIAKDMPFEPIKWRKNRQLLRYFIYSLFPKDMAAEDKELAAFMLFADKHGEQKPLPKSDKQRLEHSANYPILEKMLNNYKE